MNSLTCFLGMVVDHPIIVYLQADIGCSLGNQGRKTVAVELDGTTSVVGMFMEC